ncbi:ribonuclease H1 domain-containing protein [Enterococcus sp. AZ109]|uniref:ribonuclease H1 domain-containing protein n=1 Tax=Enterococcus sp. AZ109 TaxID=2774634 RepID=UPI003F28C77B
MAKFYAIRIGRKPGVYNTWGEAQKQVSGFKGAIFKSFPTKEEAESFVNMSTKDTPTLPNEYQAYVDGSFNKGRQQYGSGVVILKGDQIIEELSFGGNDPKYVSSYQIAGEVFACIEAVKWAKANDVKKIKIYYDYQGIASWAEKQWAANAPIAQAYVALFDELAKDVTVQFVKVKGHSGDKLNDLADELADKGTRINLTK